MKNRWLIMATLLAVLTLFVAACDLTNTGPALEPDDDAVEGIPQEPVDTDEAEMIEPSEVAEEEMVETPIDEAEAMTAEAEVVMENTTFQPREITVAPGTTVIWTNNDSFAHTVTSGTRDNPTNLILQKSPKESRKAVQPLIDKYCEPDEMTPSVLIWRNNGPWVATIATKEATEHPFPIPHTDLIEQFIRYDVPEDKLDELARYDGSVMVRRTEGLMSARCHDEPANFLALNLAHDVVTGFKTVEEAKEAYLEAMEAFRRDKQVPSMQRLQFEPQAESGDPGRQMTTKEQLQKIAQEA